MNVKHFDDVQKVWKITVCYSYTMYYENLLRGLHQNLYQKEQEGKQMRDQLKNAQVNAMVEVQCQLANQGHDLIMGELLTLGVLSPTYVVPEG